MADSERVSEEEDLQSTEIELKPKSKTKKQKKQKENTNDSNQKKVQQTPKDKKSDTGKSATIGNAKFTWDDMISE